MKNHHFVFVLILAILLSACGKSEDHKPSSTVSKEVAPDRGTVDLSGKTGQKGSVSPKTGAYQGLDPAKVEELSPEAKAMLKRRQALRDKTAANPNMNGADFMKGAGGGREIKEPKF